MTQEYIEVSNIFNHFFKGQGNMMTQKAIEYGWIKQSRRCYEISRGKGFYHDTIYGLTVLDIEDGRVFSPDFDLGLSGCFQSIEEVKERVEFLKSLW